MPSRAREEWNADWAATRQRRECSHGSNVSARKVLRSHLPGRRCVLALILLASVFLVASPASAEVSSDMPGGVSYPGGWGGIQIQDTSDVWHNLPSIYLTDVNQTYGNRWAGPQPTSSQSFNIWTANYGT